MGGGNDGRDQMKYVVYHLTGVLYFFPINVWYHVLHL